MEDEKSRATIVINTTGRCHRQVVARRDANGASEFMLEILGDAGRHARAAVGVNALPLDASVEVEFIFEVK